MNYASREIDDVDRELLELIAVEVPWGMVCGEFHERYGSPAALVRRLFELMAMGLLVVRAKASPEAPVSPAALESDAARNGCYADPSTAGGFEWEVLATDAGFRLIEDRLAAQ